MEQRADVASHLLLVIFIVTMLCIPSDQRPPCPPQADCGHDAFQPEPDHMQSFNTKYQREFEEPDAVKQLLESLQMQHNEYAEATKTSEEEHFTETPPIRAICNFGNAFNLIRAPNIEYFANHGRIKTKQNLTKKLPSTGSVIAKVKEIHNNMTFSINAGAKDFTEESFIKHSFKSTKIGAPISENSTQADVDADVDCLWGITTVEPQQLVSPLDFNEPHFETTTSRPEHVAEPVQAIDIATSLPGDYTRNSNNTTYLVNPPLIKVSKNQTRKTIATYSPLLQLFSPIQIKPDEKINSLIPAVQNQDHDVIGEIELQTLNRPISNGRPWAMNVTPSTYKYTSTNREVVKNATSPSSSQANKKPINIRPSQREDKRQPEPEADLSSKSGGSENPNPSGTKPLTSTPGESVDYLISAVVQTATEEENAVDIEYEDEQSDENEENGSEDIDASNLSNESDDEGEADEKRGENSDEEDEEDEYLTDSAEENEEQRYFNYIDAFDTSDMVSAVVDEVSSLI